MTQANITKLFSNKDHMEHRNKKIMSCAKRMKELNQSGQNFVLSICLGKSDPQTRMRGVQR